MNLFGLTKILEERKSPYNGNLRVVKTFGMGTYIQSDGLTQSGGIVESIWKETIREILKQKRNISSVLILGFGAGTVAKLVRKYLPNSEIEGIEIDKYMLELGEKYLELDKGDYKIKIGDAFKELKNIKNKYSLIIVDLYQGDQFPSNFEDGKNIILIKKILDKTGIVIFNRLYYGDKRPETVKFGRKLEKHFPDVKWFYPEANVMFICSKIQF